jgi:ABC-type antimicrobial peptide transport system permease subunit
VVNRAAVALVNRAFVDRFLPGKDPLGRTVRVPGLRTPPVRAPLDSFEVVGVVRNVLNRIYTNELVAELYIPHTVGAMANYLAVLARSSVEPLITEVPAQVYAVDRDQPVMDVKTLENVLGDWVYARPRFNLLLFSVFAGLGLTLALLGIYGVISHGVSQQTQEIGIRLALGASRRDVMSMVLRRGVLLIGLGVVIGVAASMASVRVLARQVYTLSTTDPLTFIAVSALVLLAGVAACLRPARRATRIEPVTALRYE